MVTRWRSFISDLSNQTWGQDLTMALWSTPIRPPWTWPTWQTYATLKQNKSSKTCRAGARFSAYHGVAPVVAQYHDVDWTRVIGDADSSFCRFIFSDCNKERQVRVTRYCKSNLEAFRAACKESRPVVIVNSSWESSSADSVAYDVDPLTEPELYPKQ